MRLTHLGHACILAETAGARLLFDPGTMSSFDDVRHLDAVLVTHRHPDHLDTSRLAALLAANPGARLVVDVDTVELVTGAGDHWFARPGDRLTIGDAAVDVLGGRHAAVYGDVPGCSNASYLVNDGAFLHPGDSFVVPQQDVDILAVPVDAPWLKLAEAIDYVHAVHPRIALPIHEGETRDPKKYTQLLTTLSPPGTVRTLPSRQETEL